MAATVVVTPPPSRPVRGFARWVAESTPRGSSVLNVGGGFTTWATSRLGLSELLLRRVRDPDHVDHYHRRTEYRINSIRSTRRHLEDAGFSSVEFRMWDLPRMYEPYLPRPLAGFATVWHRAAYTLGRPNLMGHLTFKAVL